MLGHIFENLLEDNKDKGAFYTPKEIVQYMTQESLIEYLRTGLERHHGALAEEDHNALCYFVRYKLKGDELPQEELRNTDLAHFFKTQLAFIQRFGAALNRLLDEVKICDPAIGSGAFPMGLLNEMYHCKVLLNNTYTPEERAAIKRHIIEHSIYGVDSEKGAVDIARLRFWLSLIVDEDRPTPLPNLDYKIVAGDSLVSKFEDQIIEIDWNDDSQQTVQFGLLGSREDRQTRELLQRMTEKQHAFFHADTTEKAALARDIRALKIDLLITQLEAMIKNQGEEQEPKGKGKAAQKQMERFLKTQGWKQTISRLRALKDQPEQPFNHFDWTLDFPEALNKTIAGDNPGFDIVIGNPPYVQLQKSGGTLAKLYQDAGFATFARTGDIYCLFYEKGHQIVKHGGNVCYITSNKWMRAGYGKALREFFLTNTTPKILIDFGDAPLFANATTYTNILLFEKRETADNHCQVFDVSRETSLAEKLSPSLETLKGRYRSEFTADRYLLVNDAEHRLKQKVEKAGIPLKDWDIQINYGIKTGYNEAFILDGAKRAELLAADPKSAEILKPILRGKDIKRYQVNFQDLWLINSHNGIKEKGIPPIDVPHDFPAIYEHLKTFQSQCEKRADQGDHWTNLRNCAYIEEFEKEKIVWGNLSTEASYAFDDAGTLLIAPSNLLTSASESVTYLIALLNSKLLSFIFQSIAYSREGNFYEFKKVFVEQLPLVKASKNVQTKLEDFVERIQQAKKRNEDTTDLEQTIDVIVYKLYDLTYDEVHVVDPDFGLSKAEFLQYRIASGE